MDLRTESTFLFFYTNYLQWDPTSAEVDFPFSDSVRGDGRDRQLPDPAETPGEGIQQRPGLDFETSPQSQQRPPLSLREAFLGGLQQSPFLQRQEKTRSAATRSVP